MKARLTAGALALVFVAALMLTSCGGGSYRTCATYSKNTAPVVHKADKAS